MEYFEILQTACKDVQLDFNVDKYNNFIKYKDMIKDWNEKVNLTAITEDNEIIQKHFIDCIKIFKFPHFKDNVNIIDIGTGAGFPGIPMKIVKENANFVLLDSLNKRVNFLNEVIKELKLEGIRTIHGRAEDYGNDINYREKYDFAVSRAVANLAVLSEFCLPFVKVGGYFIAMKGPSVAGEIEESRNAIGILGGKIENIIKVEIEGSDLEHNLVIIKKLKNIPKQYPRKAGMVTKKPLK